jgi:ribosomal protein S18 acetylase RimI-like enzyme
VPDEFRGPRMVPLARRVAERCAIVPGAIDAASLGRAAAALHREPGSWEDWDTYEETLQHIKQLWHVLVRFGRPRWAFSHSAKGPHEQASVGIIHAHGLECKMKGQETLMANVAVRRAEKGDLAAILDLYAEDEFSTSHKPTNLAPIADAFDAITTDPKAFLYVATIENRVVGTFQMNVLRHLTHGGRHVAQIEAVAVSTSWRGQGIGTEMIRFALAEARRLGCVRAQLTSQKRRGRALAFYETLGFERTHEGLKIKL